MIRTIRTNSEDPDFIELVKYLDADLVIRDGNEHSFYAQFILETGKKQPEAIALYTKKGYHITPNYGQYAGVENSVCFEKYINAKAI